MNALWLLRYCWRLLGRRQQPIGSPTPILPVIEELENRLTPSTLTVLADADAHVVKAHPGRNYGAATKLISDRSPKRETLMRFDLTEATGAVESAKVRVYVTNGARNGPAIYATGTDWSESSVTWKNRPPRVSGPLDDKARVATGWQEFDVTPWVTGNGTYSFALASTSANGLTMYSRERAGFAPQLIVTMADAAALNANAGPDRVADAGTSITFAGLANGGTGTVAYSWDFGDGQTAGNFSSPTHSYAHSGVYTVRLTVQDGAGVIASDTAVVTVKAAAAWSSPRQIGILDVDFVDESSGLAVSRAFSDRLYHINDSGDGGYFYVSDLQGQNMRRVSVNGFSPVDAEDIAYGSFGGKNYLMIGDIGDNGASRGSITLVVIEEQANFGESVNPTFQVTIRYPDGAHNAEAMALHPNGDLYIMTKESAARVYRLTADQWQTAGATQTLQYVGQFSLASQTGSSSITAMDISPDGSRLLILTYDGALELEARLANGILDFSQYTSSTGPAYQVISLTILPQQESISYLPNGYDFIYTSEFHDDAVPILEVDRLN